MQARTELREVEIEPVTVTAKARPTVIPMSFPTEANA